MANTLLSLGVFCSLVGPLLVGFSSLDLHRRVLGILFFVCNAWIFAGEPIIRMVRMAGEVLTEAFRSRG